MEPGDSGGVGAVEVAVERPMPTFVHGVCAGIALAAVAAHGWLAFTLAPLRGTYQDLGVSVPPFVLRPVWLWGMPAVGFIAFAMLVLRRPRSVVPYACVAAVLIATAFATWLFANAPFWEPAHLSG